MVTITHYQEEKALYAPAAKVKKFTWTDLWCTVTWACPCGLCRMYLDAMPSTRRGHSTNMHAPIYGPHAPD